MTTTTTRDVLALLAVWAAVALVPGMARGESLQDGIDALKSGYGSLSLPKLEDALRILRVHAAAGDPTGVAHYHLARTYQALAIRSVNDDHPTAAVRLLEEGVTSARIAVERDQNASPFHQVLGDLYGQLAGLSGVIGKVRYGRLANAEYARALALDPKNARAHVGVGIGKLETPAMFGGSAVEALAEFRRAQALDATCDEAWVWEGIALRRQGAVEAARAAFAQAIAVNPDSDHAKRELAALEDDF